MKTIWRLLQPLPVSALQGHRLEQDHLHQVQAPHLQQHHHDCCVRNNDDSHLVSLAETIYPPHLALLVRVGQHAHGGLLPRDGEHEVLPTLLCNVLPQLPQQPARPLLLHL